jgi:hypothetical protein
MGERVKTDKKAFWPPKSKTFAWGWWVSCQPAGRMPSSQPDQICVYCRVLFAGQQNDIQSQPATLLSAGLRRLAPDTKLSADFARFILGAHCLP